MKRRWIGYWIVDWWMDKKTESDIAALSKLASEVMGIPMLHELEAELFEEILTS